MVDLRTAIEKKKMNQKHCVILKGKEVLFPAEQKDNTIQAHTHRHTDIHKGVFVKRRQKLIEHAPNG